MTPEPFVESVKFDGKHWIGKKRPNEPLQIHSYEHVAQVAREQLGKNGIVAIPNARPDEYRYEEFLDKTGRVSILTNSGNAFYDPESEIYFIKAQEIKTKYNEIPMVILAYNIPFGENLSDKDGNQTLNEATKYNCILGINIPSCVKDMEKLLETCPQLFGGLDFVVGYSGTAAMYGTNNPSMEFYKDYVQGREFENPFTREKHKIGIIAISGGHRTPYGFLENMLNGGQTIGRSHIEIPKPRNENFMADLRMNLRDSKQRDMHTESIFAETLFRHIPSIYVGDKILGFFK